MTKKTVSVILDGPTDQKLEKLASSSERSKGAVIRLLIRQAPRELPDAQAAEQEPANASAER